MKLRDFEHIKHHKVISKGSCSSDLNADHKVLRTTFCQIKFIYMLSSTIHLLTSLSNSFCYKSKQPIDTSLPNSSEFLMKPLLIKDFKMNMRQFNHIFSSNDFQKKILQTSLLKNLSLIRPLFCLAVIKYILFCRLFLMYFVGFKKFLPNFFSEIN